MTVKIAERSANIVVEIAPLSYSDLPKVIAIERRSFPAPWSLAMFVLELSKPSSICLGAVHEGELIGYLVCSRYHTVWHVMNVAIENRYRRRGVATALIEHLFSETDRRGERYTLEVRISNAEAIRMYESFGFRSAGIRRRYYHDNNEDALIMWRTHHGTASEAFVPAARTQD
jgi:[ribosomal protein S18]-alanine N-acetyltransferase